MDCVKSISSFKAQLFLVALLCNTYLVWSELFEEDIQIGETEPEEFAASLQAFHNGIRNNDFGKWDRKIPYQISPRFTLDERRKILKAMYGFQNSTCIQFLERTNEEDDFIDIFPGNGCWSVIGRQRHNQSFLSLQQSECVEFGTIQHELMHALGFYHEHSRTDRDTYVNIVWNNIIEGILNKGFIKYTNSEIDAYGQPYDFDSIMHYSNNSFAKNKSRPTIIPKSPHQDKQIGQRIGLSPIDIRKIKLMYNCPMQRGEMEQSSTTSSMPTTSTSITTSTTSSTSKQPSTKRGSRNDRLQSGQSLWANGAIISANTLTELNINDDGNVLIHRLSDNESLWTAFSTVSQNSIDNPEQWGCLPTSLHMKPNGNAVISNSRRETLWESGTSGNKFTGAELVLHDDGSLCIEKNGECLWRSAMSEIKSGQEFHMHQTLWSVNKQAIVVLLESGHLTVRRGDFRNSTLWSAHQTIGETALDNLDKFGRYGTLHMQRDGNLVLSNAKGAILWESDTAKEGFDGVHLRLEDDGALCLFQPESSHRVCHWKSAVSEVKSGEYLQMRQTLYSANRTAELFFLVDGDAVINLKTCDDHLFWAASWIMTSLNLHTYHHPIVIKMQPDGNVVMLNSIQGHIWESGTGTPEFAGSSLRLDDDGSLCLFKYKELVWKSNVFEIKSGGILRPGNTLWSLNKRFRMRMYMDGNVVIQDMKRARFTWDSNTRTSDLRPKTMAMLDLGKLVIYKQGNLTPDNIIWNSDSKMIPVPGASLRLNNNGSICFFRHDACLSQWHWVYSNISQDNSEKVGYRYTTCIIGGVFLVCICALCLALCFLYKRRRINLSPLERNNINILPMRRINRSNNRNDMNKSISSKMDYIEPEQAIYESIHRSNQQSESALVTSVPEPVSCSQSGDVIINVSENNINLSSSLPSDLKSFGHITLSNNQSNCFNSDSDSFKSLSDLNQ